MSTHGSFIIRKDGTDKAMTIMYDAYPNGVGQDVIDLIKTTNLFNLYQLMTEYDEMEIPKNEEDDSGELEPFSYDVCRLAVKRQRRLWVSPSAPDYIRDSLFCEYAYVIDLDQGQLLFFVGGHTSPQKGNPYGGEPVREDGMNRAYYPCRLARVFTLEYIRSVETESIIDTMERRWSDDPCDVRYYSQGDLVVADHAEKNQIDKLPEIAAEIATMKEQLQQIRLELPDLQPACQNRIRELVRDYCCVRDSVEKLRMRIEIIR